MRRHHSLLLIDHDARRLSALTLLLQTHGYRVRGVSTPAAGWELLRQGGFVAVILSDGYELEGRGALCRWLAEQMPQITVLARERPALPDDGKTRRKLSPELSPAEILEAIRRAFLRRRAPRRVPAARSASAAG
jgi:DNA-binding NarL/FixJ family response regulator